MKQTYTCCHNGNDILSVEELCDLKGLQYIGTLVYKETDEIALDLGQVIKIRNDYYSAEITHTSTSSSLRCTLIDHFDIKQFSLLDNCDILIDIWDETITDDGPVWSLAFKATSLKRAQSRISTENDVDILINEEPMDMRTFMALTTLMSCQAVTARSA